MFTWDKKWNLPETKSQPTMKEILFTLLFTAGEMKWMSFWRMSEINDPLSKEPIILVYACTNISFHMISFRVVFTWHFINRSEISFLSKWSQWNNTRNEFRFGFHHVSSYKKLTRRRKINISFHPKWNLM